MRRQLVLASASPRRQEILRSLGVSFRVSVPNVEEDVPPGMSAAQAAIEIALRKARTCDARGTVLAMDTIVAIGRTMLGKPVDPLDAERMLRILSGRRHRVVTGVALRHGKRETTGYESTIVQFRKLKRAEILRYIRSGEPFDKAGGYAIQGLGSMFIDRIDGCYFNVVGFPIGCFQRCLRQAQLTIYDFMTEPV